jgi:nucleotide-binding universal stress UspA family protein
MREHRLKLAAEGAPVGGAFTPPLPEVSHQLSPTGRMERIMLVTDGTEFSSSAVDEAIKLATRCKARLFAYSVLANPEYETPLGQPLHKLEKQAVVERLMEVRSKAEAVGVECEILLGHGEDPYTEIVDQAEQSAMDMVVMGRRDKSDLLRTMLGSTTEKVIGHTHSDVLVVPRGAVIEGKGMVLPVDGSRYSDAAAVTTINLAKQCSTKVTVVSIATDEHMRDDAEKMVKQVQAKMAEEGIKADAEVRVGQPDEGIVACARERNADLIIMGSHGRTGLDRLLIGSISERVIGRAECPVLGVKL